MDSSNQQTSGSVSPNIPEKTPITKKASLNDINKQQSVELAKACFAFCNVNENDMCPHHPTVKSFACMPCNH